MTRSAGVSPQSLRICLVAHFAYGALTGGATGHIGGVERQTSLMARWLAGRGHRVSLVTWNEGQPDGEEIGGVRVFTVRGPHDGLPALGFFHPRWTSLNAALRRADAEVYYQNCGEYVTGQIALWCRRWDRRFVYSAAQDADCDARLPLMTTLCERVLYRFGLRRADRIVVQTNTQARLLWEGFGRQSTVIPMPCPDPEGGTGASSCEGPASGAGRILWLGRICEVKRPDRFLDLAEQCPDLAFDLVGPDDESPYSHQVLERARRIANLTVHGPATRNEVPSLYRGAACLCCTSDYEGFPNTFIEAWSHGLPVVSTWDPDRVIALHGLGASADDVPGLVAGVRGLAASPERWQTVSAAARRYYLAHHTVNDVMPRFETLFLESVAKDLSSSGRAGPPRQPVPAVRAATPHP